MTEHNDAGSLGFVLNKPLNEPISKYIEEIKVDFPVYEGGPVEKNNMYYLHSRPDIINESVHIHNNIYWSGDYQNVKEMVNSGVISENEIRFYLGYSGWSPNQLEKEIKSKSWIVSKDPELNYFKNWSTDLWKKQLKKLGGENLIWINSPLNPNLN